MRHLFSLSQGFGFDDVADIVVERTFFPFTFVGQNHDAEQDNELDRDDELQPR